MASTSRDNFGTLIEFVDQLIEIHGRLQAGPGRRHEQDALHRAGVVMTVAAWESYIEKVVMEGFDALRSHGRLVGAVPPGAAPVAATAVPPPAPAAPAAAAPAAPATPAWAIQIANVRRAELSKSVRRFNTPNAVNVRDLFVEYMEFNPWQHWTWHAGPRQWDAEEMKRRLNGWLDIRHSVAHG